MEVISIRIPKRLKEMMREVDIDWSEEIRRFIEAEVKEHRRRVVVKEVENMLAGVRGAERGTAERYVREDRDSN
ncbi:MAG: hypothetical protein NZ888_00800 [Candidatus Nitrosocaldus sp.]|nr:hypothetical protein [Candidatus Nitrosocaldus sp.]MDW7999476.1 hypothetical protein [Candidatus Nitrosocaldus sp.]